MNIFFTSDFHFGHANIIRHCNRPFSNVEEMNEILIERFNSRVKAGDLVYDLGDVSFKKSPEIYLSRLNGSITRIKGNHDENKHLPDILSYKPSGMKDNDGNQLRIVLCHYPMRSWNSSYHGSWHLFGHEHGNMPPFGLSFDIGVDCWNYYPVSLEEVAEKMRTLKNEM